MRAADALTRSLVNAGVRHVFTRSGNHIMSVFDAAFDARLDLVHTRHEAAAVHMADACAAANAADVARAVRIALRVTEARAREPSDRGPRGPGRW